MGSFNAMVMGTMSAMMMGTGISISLYGHNHNLPWNCYLSPLTFWMFVSRPFGIFWKQVTFKFLKCLDGVKSHK